MRKLNFYAGPSVLPVEVLKKIQEQFLDYKGLGLSLVETSHRSKEYEEVHTGAINLLRELMGIPQNYKILFLGGGATLQFSMIPLNFLSGGKHCDFTISGTWGKKAYEDAKKVGKVNVLFDGKSSNYMTLPEPASLKATEGAAYFHITTNETIGGLQWQDFPKTGEVPLIADMSSDILSRPVDVSKFGMIYAGAQKNLGPAGVTLAIIREDLLAKIPDTLTAYLNYNTHAKEGSLYNTPPVFSIWVMREALEYLKAQGGAEKMLANCTKKANAIYDAMARSEGFYRCPVDERFRSKMNVVFNLPTEELEEKFVNEAKKEGMLGLKGHRSVGGCRASIYNALPYEDVQTLCAFMDKFVKVNR